MKNYKVIAVLCAALSLMGCSRKATVSGTIDGYADRDLVVRQLDVNKFTVLDTIRTSANGEFSYKLDIQEGDPEFIYLYAGDNRVASLLVGSSDRISIKADTLGSCTVEGSSDSALLGEVEKAYSDFMGRMTSATTNGELVREYVSYYRSRVKFLLEHPYSLTVVPVLYQKLGENAPIFSQASDALLFRNAADSLTTVYPDSRYVKALRSEAERRLKLMDLDSKIRNAPESSYPDIVLPDMNGEQKALSSVEAKAILVHFWDLEDAAQKMINIEVLMPLYKEFHSKGLEIYSVCVSPDKAEWGSTVSAQKLPWINVNDGLGSYSPALRSFNVTTLPLSLLILNSELYSSPISGEAQLRKVLRENLR